MTMANSTNELTLRGKANKPIWAMCDGEEPYALGLRLDSGDGGVVWMTREQAAEVVSALSAMLEGQVVERQKRFKANYLTPTKTHFCSNGGDAWEVRDSEGVIVALFCGPDAEQHAKAHAAKLNEEHGQCD